MNVQELLDNKKIPYQISGGDFVVHCLNPEHDDSHPSMRIDQILGIFNCLSCGFKGNLFTLFEAPMDNLAIKREKLRRKLSDFRSNSEGLSVPKNATPYIGSWRNIAPTTYKKFEAFRSSEPEFIGRIVFPIRDITGKIVVFQGRDETGTLPKKYYNYPPHTPLPMFPKVTPINGCVALVEGIFDVLNLHDKGLTNAVCIFGINNFSQNKAYLLKMQGVSGIDCMFDPDDAGEKASEKIKILCEETNLIYRRINLKNSDPGDLSDLQVRRLKEKLYG